MREMKHTPSPWRAENGDDCSYMAEKGLASHRIIGDGWIVAMVIADVKEVSDSAEDNARLIAAAPTMYGYLENRASFGDEEAAEILRGIHADS